MPKGAANAMLGQLEVRAAQAWGLVLFTRYLRQHRNNRSPFRVVLRGALLHALVADQHWPNMWRIVFPDGRLSDMLNITRAKDALTRAQRSRQRFYR